MRWPLTALAVLAALCSLPSDPDAGPPYRLLLEVDPRGQARSGSPARVDVDFEAELRARGSSGPFDPDSIEVRALDADGAPRVVAPGRTGRRRFLLPWRLDRAWPRSRASLAFALPDGQTTRYEVRFAPLGRSRRPLPTGPVGDGDLFRQEWGRREVAASGYDTFADLDGDGDLDLVKGGTLPTLDVWENVGGNRYRPRGPLTSAGEVLLLPHDDGNRSWASPEFVDWDDDGDLDLFVHVLAGPESGRVLRYENVTVTSRKPIWEARGPLVAASGRHLNGAVSFVDWDGDGRLDVVSEDEGRLAVHRNLGGSRTISEMDLADGVYLEANGAPIELDIPRADFADLDGDGDPDVVVGSDEGRVYLFENVGRPGAPRLAVGRLFAFFEFMDCRARASIADFDGDGLLDVVVGRYWERSHWADEPRVFGRLYRNAGSRTSPRFEVRDASNGAPYQEGFLTCDAVRQNDVRAVDWDGDGLLDLLSGDSDGFVSYFHNRGDRLAPLFAPPVRVAAGGHPIKVHGEEVEGRMAGYARIALHDWDADGRRDLLVADGRGWLWLFRDRARQGLPDLEPGIRLEAGGVPVDGTSRGSVAACDWDGDGRQDLLFAMVGEGISRHASWPTLGPDPTAHRGFLLLRNRGTAAAPSLARPEWLRAGRDAAVIDLLRPNLGSCVDWDGDGLLDLIGCEFENSCRLFRNQGRPGEPRLLPGQGIELLRPWVSETISGADAVDWNGDGDLDLLSGQGHGGSGLRYFERDFVEDRLRGSEPGVRIVRSDQRQDR